MTREEQLEFCKKCTHKVRDFNKGIICKLTMQPADFEGECESFAEEITEESDSKTWKEAQQRQLLGKTLLCPLCQNDLFTARKAFLTSKTAAVFDMEYIGKSYKNFICSKCKHILWFY